MFSHGLGLPCRPSIKTLRVVSLALPRPCMYGRDGYARSPNGPTSSQECSKRRACFGRGLHQAYHAPRTGHGLIEDLDSPQPADTKEDAQDTAQINRKRTRATMCCSTKCMQLQTTVTPVGAVMLRPARAGAQVCYSIPCMQLLHKDK